MEIKQNGYSKNIVLLISNGEETHNGKASILAYKNNEIQVILDGIEDKRDNIIFDSKIDIIIKFNFNNINQDLFGLLLLIYGIRKYHPKSINLVLPYFPYTSNNFVINKKISEKENDIILNTDSSLLTILQNSGISTIKTFDLGNEYVKSYSSIYIENIRKKDIFIDEFDFFDIRKKKLSIVVLNQDDYNYFKSLYGHKENINILYINESIMSKTKTEQLNILNNLKDINSSLIYIFDKILIRGTKLYALTNLLAKNLDIEELNICITHGLFAYGSYNKFNTLMERYPFINIVTTNSVIGYNKKLTEKRTNIYKLPLLENN